MNFRAVLTIVTSAVLLLPAYPAGANVDTPAVTGELQRLSIDAFDGTDVDVTVVVPEDGDAVRVNSEQLLHVVSGATVEVRLGSITSDNQDVDDPDGGAEVLDALVLAEAETEVETDSDSAQLQALATSARSVSLLTATLPGQSPDSVTTSTLATEMTTAVGPYWSDSTGGALTFTAGNRFTPGTYSGWGSTSTCTSTQILGFLKWSAEKAGVHPTYGTGRHTLTYTPNVPACGFAGVAHVADGGSAWVNGTAASQRPAVVAHELGHTVGLGHSDSRLSCTSGMDGTKSQCHTGSYGDAYDVMGTRIGAAGPLSGAHLDVLGLLGSGTVVATGSQNVTLKAVGGLTGTRFLKFSSSGVTYYVEYRGAVGRDSDLATSRKGCPYGISACTPTRYVPGVVVRRVDKVEQGAAANLLNPGTGASFFVLEPGRSFTTADGEFTLLVESTSSGEAKVRLTRGSSQPPLIGDALYQPVAPTRVMSAVPLAAKSTYTVRVPNVPTGAVAVALNVTATGVNQTSYVSVCATGTPLTTCRATSALNPSAGTDTAAAVLVALGGPNRDEVTFYNNAGTLKLIADLQGFYVSGSGASGASFVPEPPRRAMDRSLRSAEVRTLTLTDVPDGATAVAVNVTTSAATAVSYVSACPAGQALSTCKRTSTLNPKPGRDSANFAVVKLGGTNGNQIQIYNNAGSVRTIIDVNGFFVGSAAAPASAGLFEPIQPVRAMSKIVGARSNTTLTLSDVPTGATAVVMNLTATGSSDVTYVSACPAGGSLATCITTSAFNPAPRIDTSNSVMVQLGGSKRNQVTLYNNAGTTRLIADVQGYFIP